MQPCRLPGIWFPFIMCLVFLHYPTSVAQSICIPPKNITQVSSGSVSFMCAVSPVSGNTLNFTFTGSQSNTTLRCPGTAISMSEQVINGYCKVNGNELQAVWNMEYTILSDNGTSVICQCANSSTYGFLTVYQNKGYYSILVGCVIGGFFGTLILFGLAYIALKRSKRFQQCFKGRTPQDDLTTVIEESYK